LTYTPEELGKEITMNDQIVKLEGGKAITLKVDPKTQWGKRYMCGPGGSLFDGSSTISTDLEKSPVRRSKWQEIEKDQMTFPTNILCSYYVLQEVESPKAQDILMDVAAGNGIEVFVNGKSIMKHINPYRCKYREEKVLVHLEKGKNQIVVRMYNRFEKETGFLLRPSAEQVIYKQNVTLNNPAERVKVRRTDLATQHTDTELHNLSIKVK
jgi:alpha-L-fucosidase